MQIKMHKVNTKHLKRNQSLPHERLARVALLFVECQTSASACNTAAAKRVAQDYYFLNIRCCLVQFFVSVNQVNIRLEKFC